MLIELQGQVERITYTSDETGFTVAKVRLPGRPDLIAVVGQFPSLTPGEILKMKGDWKNHPQYGRQFAVSEYQSLVPATVSGMEKYLGSGLIKGIGPVMARRIVKVFREKTLDVIENQIDRLVEVEGIGPKRLAIIRQAWVDQKEIRQVMIFLQEHGVSPTFATRIFKKYGAESIPLVRENPYRLARDIFGIGFLSADRIAASLGFTKDSPQRAAAGLVHTLYENLDQGHVYVPRTMLIEHAKNLLDITPEILEPALEAMVADQTVVIDDLGDHPGVYLAGLYTAETRVAGRLRDLMTGAKSIRWIDTDKALTWVQAQLSLTLADRQKDAVCRAVTDKILVITGGPGTGKTTIIRAVLTIYRRLSAKVLLAAPTGRAAKRMTEATGHEAKTIHRLLEFSPRQGGFIKNDRNVLEADLVIIDEASMVDVLLMHHLLKAIPDRATLIMVGDMDQLPSVGPGMVLKDIITSGAVPVVTLNEIFRQAKESAIIVNAHRINRGQMPLTTPPQDRLTDFYFIEQEQPEEALRIIIDLVKNRIPQRFGLDPLNDIQVLSPMHRGSVGAGNLNIELQSALNPGEDGVRRGGYLFRLKDKVMQVRNNYDKEVFNGDIGRITALNLEHQDVIIKFDDRLVAYDLSELDEIVPAYAISVHKSQGSEYPAVVVPVLSQHYMLLQRNLVYTAVTRGRKLVVLVGTTKALAIAVKNNKTQERFTYLSQRLQR